MSDLPRFNPNYTLIMAFLNGHTGAETELKLQK